MFILTMQMVLGVINRSFASDTLKKEEVVGHSDLVV